MLQVLGMIYNTSETDGEKLFNQNPEFLLTVRAPMYWWLDCGFEKFNLCMPTKNLEFCLDSFSDCEAVRSYLWSMKYVTRNVKLEPRQLLQIMPLSTYLEGRVKLSYQQMVEVCENYACGEYDYKELYNQWPISREWTDFCETILDVHGIREIIEKEGIL